MAYLEIGTLKGGMGKDLPDGKLRFLLIFINTFAYGKYYSTEICAL
jgi:hypothetical protein